MTGVPLFGQQLRPTSKPTTIRFGVMIIRMRHPWLDLLVGGGLVHAAYLTTSMPHGAKAATPSEFQSVRTAAGAGLAGRRQMATAGERASGLPLAVANMREAILEAVQSGRLEDLKAALDLNELKPELAADAVADPITFWRKASVDGEGRDILAVLGILLDIPHITVPLGKDPENTSLYIWPAFADRPLATLSPEEGAQLLQLEPPDKASIMRAAGKYTGWRLVIGADGVWHSFRRND